MGIIEILLIGLGLSMDAAAVSMTDGMCGRELSRGKTFLIPASFGFFQALMPLLGYYAGSLFSEFLDAYAGIVVLLILGVIGGKMIYDGLRKEEERACRRLTGLTIFLQAIATSIDAFAVGVGFSAMRVQILPTVLLIGATTFVCSLAAVFVGKRFGNWLGDKAQILGGVILILIGIKSLF